MSRARPLSPSEQRLRELSALRRPLTPYEVDEVRDLETNIRKAAEYRRRYAGNPEFRQREIQRCTRYWRENRA